MLGMLAAGASSPVIGGRVGGRTKISVRAPSRDAEEMLAASSVDYIDSSSVNVAATLSNCLGSGRFGRCGLSELLSLELRKPMPVLDDPLEILIH